MDIDLDDVDLPTTKEKGKRVSKKFNAFPEEDRSRDHNSKVLSGFSGSQSLRPMKIVSTKILDEQRKNFIAFLEEDSDHNSVVWSTFTGSRSSLPKKGDLVVYFPQGHLENGNLSRRTKEEVRTYDDLQPQIICRVEHVQLMIKEAEDDIYANITLHPEPEVNSEEKELEHSDEIEACIYYEDGSLATISTPSLFSKILDYSDLMTSSLSIPPKAAIEFFCLDNESMDLQNEVIAKDFHGKEWKFPLIRDKKKGNWLLRWSEFARARNLDLNLDLGKRVVFLREKDTKLWFGIRRTDFGSPSGITNDDPLSAAAAAILKKSIFSVMYGGPKRGHHEDFVIPYHKYMKSITRPGCIGAKVHKQNRSTGVVAAMTDLDPMNWPNSKWKCLTVKWVFSGETPRVSPWEIVFDDSSLKLIPPPFDSSLKLRPYVDIPSTFDSSLKLRPYVDIPSTFDSLLKLRPYLDIPSTFDSSLKLIPSVDSSLKLRPSRGYILRKIVEERPKDLLSDEAIRSKKQEHVQEPIPIHYEAYTTNHPFDIQKQTPALQTSSQLTLWTDPCSLTSFSDSKSTTNYKELKISNCSVDDLWRHLKENHSYEYLEFDSCSFPSSTSIPIPITIKKLKITNCVDTEQVFTVLMDPNLSVESLEIDSCSSFSSMSTGGIPATLRQLKIVNCVNLNSLSESFETEKSPSIDERVHYSKADILELRKLEIQNCQKLESLPKGMHKLRNLDLPSINDCCSLEYFPEGGFPITCLTSLSISGCENLKCLPNELHKVTSLQNLSISGCPSLMFFPEGGLPPNLVSLRIIDCESLFSISQWELHKLKHLREYSFSCGCSDSGE